MFLTHKTTHLACDCAGIDAIPVGEDKKANTKQCLSVSCIANFSSTLSTFCAFEPGVCEWGKCGVESAVLGISESTALDHISGSNLIFFWGGGTLEEISCCWTVIVWWSPCAETVDCCRPRSSRASWTPGVWSLLFWQRFRLFLSLYRCVTVFSSDLLKVRRKEEIYLAFILVISNTYLWIITGRIWDFTCKHEDKCCVGLNEPVCICHILFYSSFIPFGCSGYIMFYESLCHYSRFTDL